MTGSSPVPSGAPPDRPPRPQSDGRIPEWMRGNDELGQTMVLVLRRKIGEDELDTGGQKRESRLPEPFVIGTSVQSVVGEKEAKTIKASREGRGSRYLLRTNSRSIVEKLLNMTELIDGTKIEILSHPTLNTVQGTVYEPDSINTDEAKIEENLRSQGVHAVRRIKKRVNDKLTNTPLLVITFYGSILPKYVYFGMLRIAVRAYYPSPMICFNCGAYGHPQKYCKQAGICMRCSSPPHLADGEKCENSPHCINCEKPGHSVTSRDCPKYKEEDKIVHIKVDQCISFPEARRIYAEENKRETIANIIQVQLKQELAAKDQLIAKLQKQVDVLTKQLTSLKSAWKSRLHSQSPAPRTLSSQSSSPTQNSSPVSIKLDAPPQKTNSRPSRKDKTLISSPANSSINRRDDPEQAINHDTRTRSRSGKRHMEISPTNTSINPGKRPSTRAYDTRSLDV